MLVTVDTGGTKTLVAGFDSDGQIVSKSKFPTPKDRGEYLKTLRSALQQLAAGQAVDGLIVAMPGIVRDGVAIWCESLGWKDFDVRSSLEGVFGDAPVLVENDANLAGLAETRTLSPMPSSVLYVTVSTGIGTGIITDGHIDPALRLSEGGRALVEFDGQVREWESFASGRAIREEFGLYAHDIHDETLWEKIADRISRGFLAIIPVLQPEMIIIGGSIGTYFTQYGSLLEAQLKKSLPDHIPCPLIRQARHPEEAVIYGCYYYALDKLSD